MKTGERTREIDQNQKLEPEIRTSLEPEKYTVEFVPALDLAWKYDKATCVQCLKHLHVTYVAEYIHDVLPESKLHHEDYVITVKYPAKLKCSVIELLAEFNFCWPVIKKMWQKCKDTSPKSNRLLRFWVCIVEENCTEYQI